MLAKITSRHQVTLSRDVLEALGNPSHVEVEVSGNRVVLTPRTPDLTELVQRRLEAMGVTEADIPDAIAWARLRAMPT